MSSRVVNATQFKATCLALLDEVEQRGGSITVTKRGRPVAVLGPVKRKGWKSPKNSWAGKVEIVGDIVGDMADMWDVVRESEKQGA